MDSSEPDPHKMRDSLDPRVGPQNGISIGSTHRSNAPNAFQWGEQRPKNCPFPCGSGPHIMHDS